MTNAVNRLDPPALPIAEEQYRSRYFNSYNNILRLFFNRLNGIFEQLFSNDAGGRTLYYPYGIYYSFDDQNVPSIDTPTLITLNLNAGDNAFTMTGGEIRPTYSGIYKLEVSANFNTTGASSRVTMWVEINGIPELAVIESPVSGYTNVALSTVLDLEPNDAVRVIWATASTDVFLDATPGVSPYPQIPAAAVNLAFVSNSP